MNFPSVLTFLFAHLEHCLCGLILFARLSDIGSTYLVTPTLQLEANPVMRKLGWRFALLTVLLCFVPYYSTAIGVLVLVPSLLVTASNVTAIWLVRAVGETEYLEFIQRAAHRTSLGRALVGVLVSSFFIALAGAALLCLSPDPQKDWGYWFACGLLAYAFGLAFHRSLFFVRLFRRARATGSPLVTNSASQR